MTSEENTKWDRFADRHIGPQPDEERAMLAAVGYPSVEALVDAALPKDIRFDRPLDLPGAATEAVATTELSQLAARNQVYRSYLGMGYSDCIVPGVIQRNVLENPGWYTQYTPYQAEIAQGRLEALLNFQTMVADLTGMELANASLLDEATAAAEAMTLAAGLRRDPSKNQFFVSRGCHPQTLAVVRMRAEPLGLDVVVGEENEMPPDAKWFGALLQYPRTEGAVRDYRPWIEKAKANGTLVVLSADILALTLLTPPGELGADIAVGSTQRFGVPMGYGGPHAAYFATKAEHSRRLPGRIVGVSKDRDGRNGIRLTLQTREQHIRRDKATSNICTAQVLLAVMAGFYGVYHGPEGLVRIARRVEGLTNRLADGLRRLGYDTGTEARFDTLYVRTPERDALVALAHEDGMNFRPLDAGIGLSLDETTTVADVDRILRVFAKGRPVPPSAHEPASTLPEALRRKSQFLKHPTFHQYRSETEMLRYIRRLESRDLSLAHSMIPLGSCTMKLNASAEMFPVTWPRFGGVHPFAPAEQALGYRTLFSDLEKWISEITGFDGVSLQPNSGAQGEYAGLLVIRAYHRDRGDTKRNVCLIPKSAHGTNPASAVMAGMQVVAVECDERGNVDVPDLRKKAELHKDKLAALMVTYPSTHGIFENEIREICKIVHERGGQVYLDGANLNAQVGYCRPGDYGADVCHLNLHKTFCIPHGGGGPGMGPIAVKSHLAPFLPGHPVVRTGGTKAIGPVSAAPWGSASILTISWMYIRMMGAEGLKRATGMAILGANYMAKRLETKLPLLYKGNHGLVAHECIVDLRDLKKRADVEVEDVAKRLIDYGFHAPTVSWPVAGTIMIEPTESESKAEMDRFCDAVLSIAAEADTIASGKWPRDNNPLKNSPHTSGDLAREEWTFPYSRATAVFPAPWTRDRKFWPAVARIDNVHGDRNLFCNCPPVEDT